ncbi:hypothetical protein THMIRHAS_02390 [Thiosulfatimonas sediminis]|uniref:ATP-grasp domain-containing protein n=1 Tax=Thiosulfatimonas sediminis TaxID=2675054 RepID=A0A6F8PS06_9GAMM|nr:RimK family protein [Thiosulfatimonas sediminis]BBP44866.1 hypothetical protein THMIRHAS_02390 [Thiosulfatimonas sediminis]
MSQFYVVVDKLADWEPYFPSQDVISLDDYLSEVHSKAGKKVRVINLCRDYHYLKSGYYCSLLAEARGHKVIPSLTSINDLSRQSLSSLQFVWADALLLKLPQPSQDEIHTLRICFGRVLDKAFSKLAAKLFELLPCPILEAQLKYSNGRWQLRNVKPLGLKHLSTSAEQTLFAAALEKFSLQIWRKPKVRKAFRYDLAILVDPQEALPPSDEDALQYFTKAANQLGIGVERITRRDSARLAEFDALFIRETTSVDHHTYRMAKKAEAEGLVVIDDSASILRCTNKVYLADLFSVNQVATPKTVLLRQPTDARLKALVKEIGLPMVLKIPDGAFSRGVVKVETEAELLVQAQLLLKESVMLLVQEFMYTQYDWRIGILNNQPLYACRYYMVADHWQIYKHESAQSANTEAESGGFDTLPTFEVPKAVLDVALKATKLIGNGFYGVDVKQSGDRVVVIEVNDNPSIDHEVEDLYLGEQLYSEVMKEFLRRLEERGR